MIISAPGKGGSHNMGLGEGGGGVPVGVPSEKNLIGDGTI